VRVRGLWSYVAVATGFVCASLLAGGAFAGTARNAQVRTYSTRPTRPLRTALLDPHTFSGSDPTTAFTMARQTGATYLRLQVGWQTIAPVVQPEGFIASDPASPGYSWNTLDTTVEAAESAGLTPILDIVAPPSWAYKTQPEGVNAGSPDVKALGDFATALATHYDGLTPGVPVEHVFQVWNEVNNSLDLSPASASTYRAMVNAVADSVHAVDPMNRSVTRRARNNSGTRLRRSRSCARCSASRRGSILT